MTVRIAADRVAERAASHEGWLPDFLHGKIAVQVHTIRVLHRARNGPDAPFPKEEDIKTPHFSVINMV